MLDARLCIILAELIIVYYPSAYGAVLGLAMTAMAVMFGDQREAKS